LKFHKCLISLEIRHIYVFAILINDKKKYSINWYDGVW